MEEFFLDAAQGSRNNEKPNAAQKFQGFLNSPGYVNPLDIYEIYSKHGANADSDKNGLLTKEEIRKFKDNLCTNIDVTANANGCTDAQQKELKYLESAKFFVPDNGVNTRGGDRREVD